MDGEGGTYQLFHDIVHDLACMHTAHKDRRPRILDLLGFPCLRRALGPRIPWFSNILANQ